jgi:DNA-directed RNA polymerase specialized sigma24 family protein
VIVQPVADTATDAELIVQSRADPERFAAIFDRHAPGVHRYLARRVGPSLADDLTAETFLVAFRQRGRYDAAQADARGLAVRYRHQPGTSGAAE